MSKLLNLRQTGRNNASKIASSNHHKTSSMMSSIFLQRTSFSMTKYKSALHTQVNVTRHNFDLKQSLWRQPLKRHQQQQQFLQQKDKQLRKQSTTTASNRGGGSTTDALTIDLLGWQVKVPKGTIDRYD